MRVFFCIVVCIIFLSGCQKKAEKVNIEKTTLEAKTGEWEVNLRYSRFSSANEKINESCEVLNNEIYKLTEQLQDSLKTGAAEMFKMFEVKSISRPFWSYSLFVTDSVFFATEQYISVRLTVYTFTGGAHGMTDFYSFNYDVENQRMLVFEDIINDKAEHINTLLKSNFVNTENCFTADPKLDLVSVVNFTPTDVCFTYPQYSLGPYACGAAEVVVPLRELQSHFLLSLK